MMGRIRKAVHWHRDPHWQVHGAHDYEQCRCGARRVTRRWSNMFGPVAYGWPGTKDRHNAPQLSSGWVERPDNGWLSRRDNLDAEMPRRLPAPGPGPASR